MKRRRSFITLLGGAAAWPLAARAQQPGRLPTIGFLGAATLSIWSPWIAPFVERLREVGWIENRTIAIEYRWAQGRGERFVEFAAELVRLKVDIIVTTGTGVPAAKQATSRIPIVFAVASDPIGNDLVPNLARPGGNVTGLSLQQTDLAAKRHEILHEILPGLRRLAIMAGMGNPGAVLEMREVQTAALTRGVEVVTLEIGRVDDIASALEGLKGRADALYVCGDPLVTAHQIRINNLTLAARLPAMYGFREHVDTGGLVSYGPSFPHLFRRAADYVDKILRGAKAGDLPVEQPTKFELVFNLALGLDVPPTLLAGADEVIE